MSDPLQRLIVAWSESPQCKKKLSARQLLRLSKGPLRKALNATKVGSGGATKPNLLGIFLSANKDMLCRGYYIRADYEARFKQFVYFLEKVPDNELRRLAFETSLAEEKRLEVERSQRHKKLTPPNQKVVYLTPPNTDWWSHERTAQGVADNLCAAHFDASLDYGPGGNVCAVRIQRSCVEDVKKYCRKHRMEYHRVRKIESPFKFEGKKTVIESSPVIPSIGYFPEMKFLERALVEDHARIGGNRSGAFLWDIF